MSPFGCLFDEFLLVRAKFIHDSVVYEPLLEKVIEKHGKPA
jgi:hypothetical protein